MSCGHRCGSEPALLWPWRRLAATAPIGPLAWESPHAMGAALGKTKKKDKKKKSGERNCFSLYALHALNQMCSLPIQCNNL